MKIFIFLTVWIVALLIPGIISAQGTTLTVLTGNGEKFTLFLNGEQKNSKPGDYVRVDNLYGPSFKVRIVFAEPVRGEISKTVFNKPGGEIYYLLKSGKKGDYVFESVPDDSGRQSIESEPPAEKPGKTGKKSSVQGSGTSGKTGCDIPMPEADFRASTALISNAPFDGPKLSSAKKLVTTHCLTCDQIVEVMNLMSSESSRLTIAKEGYLHCYDPSEYGKVKDVLNSDKSRGDLDHHINSLK